MKRKSISIAILAHLFFATALLADKSADDYIADLKSEDMNMQVAAAHKLGTDKVEKALPDLIALLQAPGDDVQMAAAAAIGAIGKKDSASDELLALTAKSRNSLVKYAAFLALANTAGKEKQADFQSALEKELASGDALLKDLAQKLKKDTAAKEEEAKEG